MNTVKDDIDFVIDPAGLGEALLEKLDLMRQTDPIFWSAKNNAWIVTGHAQVSAGFSGRLPTSSVHLPGHAVALIPPEDRQARFPYVMNAPRAWLLNMDDPEHQRLRRLMVKAFSKPVVEAMRPHSRRYIREALDAAEGRDSIEFVDEVARVVPGRLILQILGLPETLLDRLHYWSVVMNSLGGLNVPESRLAEIETVMGELYELFEPEWQKRRENPTDDFLSALVTANEDGDRLSREEMFGICAITLLGGHDTTTNTMTLATIALANDPAMRDVIRDDEELRANAIMELQRRIGMSTVQARSVAEDFDWEGHAMRKGDLILLFIGAANRDPVAFPDPMTMDPARRQTTNLTFAPGIHHCIGHLLAKMQLGEFFPEFLRRFDPEILDDQLDWSTLLPFRGLESLRVRLHSRG